MPSINVLTECEPFVPINDPEMPDYDQWYRGCDYCGESISDDIANNIGWRQFYILEPGTLSVCEHCIDKITD